MRQSIGRVIFGQHEVIDQTLITLLAGGHVLLIGVPGLAKTRLVETLGVVLGLDDKRVQFTPDLMPADILGSEVLEESDTGRRSFRFIQGPVFCQLLMADEINRASPRTQSALLQAMQEHRVSVAGQYHPLPRPFHVLATQNPLEQEGTYPLPEAQLDRFLLQIDVAYPELEAERQMLIATTGSAEDKPLAGDDAPKICWRRSGWCAACRSARAWSRRSSRWCAPAAPRRSDCRRGAPPCRLGPGPARQPGADAGLPRPRAARRPPRALDRRRAWRWRRPVLRHRMALNFAARADGVTLDEVIDRLCAPLSSSAARPVAAWPKTRPRSRQRGARQLASTLPPLLVAAERVAPTVAQGVHGRRRVGQGETFWQFRRYQPATPRQRIDWRQSAKSRAAVRARDRMGGGAERLAVARRLALDALALAASGCPRSASAPSC